MMNIMYFFLAVAALVLGYFTYGVFVEKIFKSDPDRPTPAKTQADGVDYVEMPSKRVWLIQLLNIAGLGPVFGPILGALYGPSALVWIVLGSIFAGGVHDYFAGMLSIRYGGANVPNLVGYNLGAPFKHFMRFFAVLLLLLVGVTFTTGPALLLTSITPDYMNYMFWLAVIFIYYILATLLPIHKLIGKVYPYFAAVLIFMAVGTITMLIVRGYEFFPTAQWANQHPTGLPMWPLMFITIACGAISGFHATQSPLMSRCMSNERAGRPIFYGAMIAEGIIALVWATVGMSFYATPELLNAALAAGGPGNVVREACLTLLGPIGGVVAILGVIILPVTSGDTAFRAARITIAEILNFSQLKRLNRLYISIPLFAIGIAISQLDFNIIWRYFGWANQTLAMVVLWAGAAYLYKRDRLHWICTVPATFMTAVTFTYIAYEPNMGFGIPIDTANIIGIVIAIAALVAFMVFGKRPVAGAPMNA